MRISQVTRKTRAAFAAAITILAISTTAAAQPGGDPVGAPPPPPSGYYPPPPPPSRGYAPPPPAPYYLPPVSYRRGLTLGAGLGFGDMDGANNPIRCLDCDYNTGAFGFDLHIGAMVNPRLALLFEVWGTLKPLDSQGLETLSQTLALVAAQYWLNPRLWIKAGIGFAHLGISYGDSYEGEQSIDDGGAIMGAIGYELVTTRHGNHEFSLDLQLRLGAGSYEGIDEQVSAGTLSLGLNWY